MLPAVWRDDEPPEPHRHHRLLLVRAGGAVKRGAWPGPADTRPLSTKGRKHVRRVARFLAGRSVDVTAVVCGPEARERETAEVLAAWLSTRVIVDARVSAGLSMDGLEQVLDDTAARDLLPAHRQRTLLVASDPLASLLLVRLTDSPGLDLAPAGAASLRMRDALAPGCASVAWLVEPSMLRGIRSRRSRAAALPARDRELVSAPA
jgi:phosphohistidine phosphatase SixA